MAVILKHAWNPPAEGSEERKKMPKDAFLSPSNRTFPYKYFKDGKWIASEEGLKSAIALANMHDHPAIASKASKLLDELFPKKLKHKSVDDVLAHYGVMGMRWGVRNDESKKRAKNKAAESGIKKERKETSKKRRQLSDKTLKEKVDRLQMEKKLKDLTNDDINPGRSVTSSILKQIGKSTATGVGTAVATYAIKAAMEQRFDLKEAAKFIRPKK